ncbi:DUF378 domain-containing protein [bacterium]|nr:DUF378 domain-containing protein [bacterium]
MRENGFVKFLCGLSYILVIIGAINWGLIGFFDFDLVAFLFGEMTFLSRLVYDIVGVSAIISVICTSICMRSEDRY